MKNYGRNNLTLNWMLFAAAIVKSGECDESFKNSEWCSFLKDSVAEFLQNEDSVKIPQLPKKRG